MQNATLPILVVDDDTVTRHVLVGYLARAGFTTVTAATGEEALAMARSMPLALVLLDLVLPDPDGYEVLKLLRVDPKTRDLPAVVLTALDGDADIERAFESGADDFLRKPFRAAELLARIRGQLRLRSYLVELGEKERDAKALVELTQTLASSLEFREILFMVVRRIADAAQVDRCSILVVRPEGDVGLVVAASHDAQVQSARVQLDRFPEVQQVLRSRTPQTLEVPPGHPLLDGLGGVRSDSTRSVSVTLLPIAFENRAMGALVLQASVDRGPLSERERSFCHIAANATAIAIRNARVLQELRDETQAITTARFEAEHRVHMLERYADLFASAVDGMVVIDHGGRTLFANPRSVEILGYSEGEMQRTRALDVVAEIDQDKVSDLRSGFDRGVFPSHIELRIRRSDGEVRTLSCSFSSLKHEENAILITLRDVTAERAMANELARTKDFLDRLIESSPDAIVAADRKGTILLWNNAAERILGLPRALMLGVRSVESIYPTGTAREIMRMIRDDGYGGVGRLEAFRTSLVASNGEEIPILLSAAIVYEGDRPAGTVGVFLDIRERLRLQENLAAAHQKLADREKQSLVAELAGAAAHELNQPLTSIMGYTELLLRRVSRESPASHAAEVIMRETERMAEIVRKIGRITHYETKEYVGGTSIIDLDRAAASRSEKPGPG